MRKILLLCISTTLGAALSPGCGTSLYRPLSAKDTSAALREETILHLNGGEYENAVTSAERLWAKEKTNENASLYSIALASTAGIGLFDLTVKSIQSSTPTASNSAATSAGNNVFNSLSSVLPSFTDDQLTRIKQSIEILDAAPDKKSPRLIFQRCLTAAIYTVPTIANLQKSISGVQTTLSSLPNKLGTGGGTSCNTSTATINATAAEVTNSISNLATIASDFSKAMAIMDECFPSTDGKASLNSVSQQVSKLKTNADKGCNVPANQKVGSYTLPSCLNDTITATGGSSAQAGDGIVAGCELFLNCPSGTCL